MAAAQPASPSGRGGGVCVIFGLGYTGSAFARLLLAQRGESERRAVQKAERKAGRRIKVAAQSSAAEAGDNGGGGEQREMQRRMEAIQRGALQSLPLPDEEELSLTDDEAERITDAVIRAFHVTADGWTEC